MELTDSIVRVHGGADAGGAPRRDFSTCSNAAGPCPAALAAVQVADATGHPDPAASAVRRAPVDAARLRGHGVAVRDATSFGLAGCWRVSAQPPDAREALMHALGAAA